MNKGPNSKRMRGRNNGRRNNNGGGGGNRLHHMVDSNGPEGRVRGTAQQVLEKYLALARDAHSAGDRITAENYYQHAEHYFRVISNAMGPRDRDHRGPQPADGLPVLGDDMSESMSADTAAEDDGPDDESEAETEAGDGADKPAAESEPEAEPEPLRVRA